MTLCSWQKKTPSHDNRSNQNIYSIWFDTKQNLRVGCMVVVVIIVVVTSCVVAVVAVTVVVVIGVSPTTQMSGRTIQKVNFQTQHKTSSDLPLKKGSKIMKTRPMPICRGQQLWPAKTASVGGLFSCVCVRANAFHNVRAICAGAHRASKETHKHPYTTRIGETTRSGTVI